MTTKIYIPLLDEGSPVSRPTEAVPMGDQVFLVLPTENYERSEEEWEFPPGGVVFCEKKIKNGRELLVAIRLIKNKNERFNKAGVAPYVQLETKQTIVVDRCNKPSHTA